MKTLPLAVAALLTAFLLTSAPALAHKLKLFAQAEGAAIVGTAYFAGGGKAMNSTGKVLAPDGSLAASFTTDGEGRFRVAVAVRQDYRLHVDSGDGHVAETMVHAGELPESLPAGQTAAQATAAPAAGTAAMPAAADATAIETALAHQLRPLREQIDQMEERARFSDIMGGIGTIFGIFGIAAWVAAKRGRKP